MGSGVRRQRKGFLGHDLSQAPPASSDGRGRRSSSGNPQQAMRIELPNQWSPRDYQRPLWRYMHNGGKRAIVIWPRRHGKDDVALHFAAMSAMERVGVYWHLLPQHNQARKAIW